MVGPVLVDLRSPLADSWSRQVVKTGLYAKDDSVLQMFIALCLEIMTTPKSRVRVATEALEAPTSKAPS